MTPNTANEIVVIKMCDMRERRAPKTYFTMRENSLKCLASHGDGSVDEFGAKDDGIVVPSTMTQIEDTEIIAIVCIYAAVVRVSHLLVCAHCLRMAFKNLISNYSMLFVSVYGQMPLYTNFKLCAIYFEQISKKTLTELVGWWVGGCASSYNSERHILLLFRREQFESHIKLYTILPRRQI